MRNRAPFVWTPEQPVDPEGFLAGMKGLPARDDGRNRWFLFRVEVEFKDVPGSAPVAVTCDGRYQLFVNGVRAGRGPVRSSPMSQKFDAYDLAPYLRTGPNVVAAIVHALGVDTAWYESVKGMWRPTFGDGGWWLEGKGDATPLSTGTDWRVLRSDAWEERTERMNSGLGFVEWLDARRLPQCWTEPGFDDRSWLPVQVLHRDGGGPDQYFGGIDVEPFPILLPNPLPPLAETHKRPERAFDARVVEIRSDLPVHRQLYEEPLLAGDPLVDRGEAGLRVRTEPNRGVTLLYRFDRLLTGYPFIEVEAVGGEEIDIAVAERLPDEYERGVWGRASHCARTGAGSRRACRPLCLPSGATAVRTLRMVGYSMDASDDPQCSRRPVRSRSRMRIYSLSDQDGGAFTCDDSFLDRLWVTGRDTLRLCMHDAWEDCPSREQRQWLGDVTVEHLAGQAAFGPSADPLTAKYLMDVADSQRPDGLTQMFAPGDHKTDALLIPDWTSAYGADRGRLLAHTGDACRR
jgi:hypothetical protein